MASEWYLLAPPYSQTSGYEDDVLDYSVDAFAEALDSCLAVDVEYCSPDLSECTEIKAIIEKNVQDTKLQSLSREILVAIGTCEAGYYIKYKNRYWLIVGLVDDNKMYEKAILSLCNWKMEWLNDDGEVVERWANVQSASQYNNGQRETIPYTIRTDQLMICMPYDRECILLDEGKRFIIDKRVDIYAEDITDDNAPYTNFKLITYECTRNDSVLYNYEGSGHYEILVTQDEQHTNDGYYVIDDVGHWICPTDSELEEINADDDSGDTLVSTADIVGDSDIIYVGLGAVEFTAVFYDADGNVTDGTAEWVIDCDFSDSLEIDYIDNTICIAVNDYSVLNKSFGLSLTGYDTAVEVSIVALI